MWHHANVPLPICPVAAPKITYDDEFRRPLGLKQGATIYIEVDIMGQPFPTVSWFHGERTLDDDARTTIETMDGFSVLKVTIVLD